MKKIKNGGGDPKKNKRAKDMPMKLLSDGSLSNPSFLLPTYEISVNSRTGKTTGKFNKKEMRAYRRNMDEVSINSPGPRGKFSKQIGDLANKQLSDIRGRKAMTREMKPLEVNIALSRNKSYSIPGQDIDQDAKSMYDMETGPRKGDLIYGRHLKKGKDNTIMDYDYKLKPGKKEGTWKTKGIK